MPRQYIGLPIEQDKRKAGLACLNYGRYGAMRHGKPMDT